MTCFLYDDTLTEAHVAAQLMKMRPEGDLAEAVMVTNRESAPDRGLPAHCITNQHTESNNESLAPEMKDLCAWQSPSQAEQRLFQLMPDAVHAPHLCVIPHA